MKTKIIKRIVLYPFAALYALAVHIRNILFDVKVLKIYQPSFFTINVGNIQVGGTGKTPHVSLLLDIFKDEDTAVLSRGYGRKTKGVVVADENSTAEDIGDEPLLLYRKHVIDLVVAEKRVEGVKAIDKKNKVLILDDAYQHRYIKPHLNILLTTFNEPLSSDCLLPLGNLREFKFEAKRADIVVVTKCHSCLSKEDKNETITHLVKYLKPGTPIFFSFIKYSEPMNRINKLFKGSLETVIICGIAKPEYFINYASQNFNIIEKYVFSDHYNYTIEDLRPLEKKYEDVQYITTYKDFVKLEPIISHSMRQRLYYIPIDISFENQSVFEEIILKSYENHKKLKI